MRRAPGGTGGGETASSRPGVRGGGAPRGTGGRRRDDSPTRLADQGRSERQVRNLREAAGQRHPLRRAPADSRHPEKSPAGSVAKRAATGVLLPGLRRRAPQRPGAPMTGPQQLPLAAIRMDGGTQSRAALSEDAISDYAAAYAAGVAMPPVVVFLDAHGLYWLADGFHRCYGAQRRGAKTIAAEVHHGTQRDAILYSVGANAQHGLRRTNADKRRAVEMLLRDPEWSAKSDRWIATATGVHHETVASYRVAAPAHVAESATSDGASRRAGRDGKSYPARSRETITPDASAASMGPGGHTGFDSAPAGGEKPATFEREPG